MLCFIFSCYMFLYLYYYVLHCSLYMFIFKLYIWHFIIHISIVYILLTTHWHSIDTQLTPHWPTIDQPLNLPPIDSPSNSVDIPLTLHWHSIDPPLTYRWPTVDLPLTYRWPSIYSSLTPPLTPHWLTIDPPLTLHWPPNWLPIDHQLILHWPLIDPPLFIDTHLAGSMPGMGPRRWQGGGPRVCTATSQTCKCEVHRPYAGEMGKWWCCMGNSLLNSWAVWRETRGEWWQRRWLYNYICKNHIYIYIHSKCSCNIYLYIYIYIYVIVVYYVVLCFILLYFTFLYFYNLYMYMSYFYMCIVYIIYFWCFYLFYIGEILYMHFKKNKVTYKQTNKQQQVVVVFCRQWTTTRKEQSCSTKKNNVAKGAFACDMTSLIWVWSAQTCRSYRNQVWSGLSTSYRSPKMIHGNRGSAPKSSPSSMTCSPGMQRASWTKCKWGRKKGGSWHKQWCHYVGQKKGHFRKAS